MPIYLSLGPNHKGHVVVDTVDGGAQVFRFCPSTCGISRGPVDVEASHALQAIGREKHGDAVCGDKRRDFITPRIHPLSQGLQFAPMPIFIQ